MPFVWRFVRIVSNNLNLKLNYVSIELKIKTKKDVGGAKICSNPLCQHSSNDHYSPLHPKSAGDLMDSSCALCPCEKFEEV